MAYLDHAATTPVRPEARDAMWPWLDGRTGNPSGAHRLARDARRAIDDARDVFAAATGFAPGDIVFTSGGTESDNLAIRGPVGRGPRVCAATEHHAVLESVEAMEGRIVRVRADGSIDLDHLAACLDDTVSVVSVMTVNNETGVVADIAGVVDLVRDRAPGALVHTDAVQALTWTDLAAVTAGVDLLSLSAHKFGGPQGVGVLAVAPTATLQAQAIGGGQERGRRSGTQNVAGIVGAAAAAQSVLQTRTALIARTTALRERLLRGLCAAITDLHVTAPSGPGHPAVAPGTVHVCLPGVEAEALLVLLEDGELYASAAASCASGAQDPSHVLAAMGVDRALAVGSLRLSLGWSTTDDDIDRALAVIPAAVEQLRRHAAVAATDRPA